MASEFSDEHTGYLSLTDEEFIQADDKVDGLQKEAHAFLEYGKEYERYWTAKSFLSQFEVAVKIANIKYPKERGVLSLTIVVAMEHLLKML